MNNLFTATDFCKILNTKITYSSREKKIYIFIKRRIPTHTPLSILCQIIKSEIVIYRSIEEKIYHQFSDAGIAVVAVFVITSCLVTLIMLIIWKASIWRIALFFIVFFSLDTIYLSSVLAKFTQGGYLPIAFSFVLMTMMGIWHYVHRERYLFELNNKVSSEYVRDLAKNPQIKRVPGIGLLYSELVQGIPPIFPHFTSSITSVHSVVVLVSIKSIPISKVALEERFLFRMVEPREYQVFRCVVRYGYNDRIEEPKVFEQQLVEHLKEFIRHEHYIVADGSPEQMLDPGNIQNSGLLQKDGKPGRSSSSTVHVGESLPQTEPSASRVSSGSIQSFNAAKSTNSSAQLIAGSTQLVVEEEQQIVQKAMDQGVFYLLGEAEVVAKQDSSFFKKFIVNYAWCCFVLVDQFFLPIAEEQCDLSNA